jgi:predicted dienelactone hydrolase
MQLFDSLTLLVLLVFLLVLYLPAIKRPSWLHLLPPLALVLALFHLFAEGFRWQMVPASVVLLIVLLLTGWRYWKTNAGVKTGRWATVRRATGVSLAVMLLLSSGLFSWLFPMFELPQPSGPFAVGLTEFHMIDRSRPETYTPDPSDVRELMVQAWYPAEPDKGAAPSPYWRHAMVRSAELTKGLGMPSFLFSHLGLIPTHSFWDAPPSAVQQAFPVLIFSHGFGQGWAAQNTSLMETLASRGYIIFGIDHAYVGMATIYPDGRLAAFDTDTFSGMNGPPDPETAALFEELMASTDWREQTALLEKAMAKMPKGVAAAMNEALDIWAADLLFVLKELGKLQSGAREDDQNGRFKGRLDLSRLGFFGMSFGGSTSLENCIKDSRCKAGINMDGFQGPQMELPPLERPFMFMNSENTLLFNAMFDIALGPTYAVNIGGSQHLNYADFSIMSPLYQMTGILGPIDGYRMLEITEAYVLAFFDKYLKGQAAPLLDSSVEDYAEVEFKKKNAD